MDVKDLKKFVPPRKRHFITDEFAEKVERISNDEEFRDVFKENLFRFSDIWEEMPNISLQEFASAVLFCSYRLLGKTAVDSYKLTFPERYARHIQKPNGAFNIERYANGFSKTKAVVKILERSLVPVHILNADLHQEAINVQAELMRTAKSENVRMKAAECLIIALKPPEEAVLNVNVKHTSTMLDDLKETTRLLAIEQKKALLEGRKEISDIAESEIIAIEGSVKDLQEDSEEQDSEWDKTA